MLIKLKYIFSQISALFSMIIFPPEKLKIRQVKVNNYQLLVCSNETIGRQIAWNGGYEIAESRFIADFIKPTDVCLDVGANIGYYTLLMASRVPKGQVYSFEPVPLCYHLLQSSIYFNKFVNITVNNCAVGEEAGKEPLFIASDSAFSSLRSSIECNFAKKIDVKVITLDDYTSSEGIAKVDFLKIDVEGAEMLVINGATKLLSDVNRRPRLMMLELSACHLQKFSSNVTAIVDVLKTHGYHAKILKNNKLLSYNTEDSLMYYNIFFVLF
ncbi:MAG: FkbM family methyltransferase [Candidatus Aceula meridiana]|nr:FkbM family methyltransferase [Candidatus Aceula meridiana]